MWDESIFSELKMKTPLLNVRKAAQKGKNFKTDQKSLGEGVVDGRLQPVGPMDGHSLLCVGASKR